MDVAVVVADLHKKWYCKKSKFAEHNIFLSNFWWFNINGDVDHEVSINENLVKIYCIEDFRNCTKYHFLSSLTTSH